MTKKQAEQMEQPFVDPMAPSHTRILDLEIDDVPFSFHWTRSLVAELLEVLAGRKSKPDESPRKEFNRMLLKTVDSSQKGLLLDALNNRNNFTLASDLINDMLDPLTENETRIGRPTCTSKGDIKAVVIPLITDGETRAFTFKADRNQYDEFQGTKNSDDIASATNGFLSDCLDSEEKRLEFNKLEWDERNFTLGVKVFGKVTRFFGRNQTITTKPILRKSVK